MNTSYSQSNDLLENVNLLWVFFHGEIMQPIDYKPIFRFFTGMLGRTAGCYADVVRHKLSWES
jgi:hypothetical protein